MNWKSTYTRWLNFTELDQELRQQLKDLDQTRLEECFYRNLEFGTGGMRGILGPGTNRR